MCKNNCFIFIFINILFFSGCMNSQKSNRFDSFFIEMENIDRTYLNFKIPSDYNTYTRGNLQLLLKKIEDVGDLETIFWSCLKKSNAYLEDQSRIQFDYPYYEVLPLIMSRLADINTAESCKVLVNLYLSRNVRWDGGNALIAEESIVRGRKHTQTILKRKYQINNGEKNKIKYVLDIIELRIKN